MVWTQPDPDRPGDLLASCDNPACGEWSLWAKNTDGRLQVTRRIPAAERDVIWPVARPATETTARRGRRA